MKIKQKQKILLIILGLFIVAMSILNLMNSKYITLEKAYKIANNSFDKRDDIKLLSITSADKEGVSDTRDGQGAKRRFWNIQFAIPNTSEHYIVEIVDGQILNTNQVRGIKLDENKFISFEDISFETSDALKIAKKEVGLKEGQDWAKGYHFTLDNIGDDTILSIIGLDDKDYFTKISFDMRTGKIIGDVRKPFE